jgi:pimeloyl-ACP methyl ester carboxylesterase
MPFAVLDGIKTHYMKLGSGPCLLMMAPRGFNSRIESWQAGKWQAMDVFNAMARHFTVVAYDRRECGLSGGRVEVLSWQTYAQQAKLLLEHLDIDKAWVIGPCMGASVAAKFGALYPETCIGLMLPQPVGGHRWMQRMRGFFERHVQFVRERGLEAVCERARNERKGFQEDPESGLWGSTIVNDPAFAARFVKQPVARYVETVEASRDGMFADTFVSGASAEELLAIEVPALVWPGDDPSHATSAAHQMRELLPRARYWDMHPSKQTGANMLEQLLKFRLDVLEGTFAAGQAA